MNSSKILLARNIDPDFNTTMTGVGGMTCCGEYTFKHDKIVFLFTTFKKLVECYKQEFYYIVFELASYSNSR